MPRRREGEEKHYHIVENWLEERGYFCGRDMVYTGTKKERLYVKAGTKKLKGDVIGLKNVGNDFIDKIEIVTVEVKDKERVSFRDILQAYGYSIFSHKVFLASTAKPSEDDKATASRMGVGLLQLTDKGPKEILSASQKQPDEAEMLALLHSLWIVRCTICGCYVFKWDTVSDIEGKSYFVMKRARQFDYMCNFDSQNTPFGDLGKKDLPNKYVILRFICRTCSDELGLKKK